VLEPDSTAPARFGGIGCLVRLYWFLAGNVALLILARAILQARDGFLTWRDAAFWAVAASLALVRYLDVRFLGGRTAEGTPATPRHWRRYTVSLATASLIVWGLAHAAAHWWR